MSSLVSGFLSDMGRTASFSSFGGVLSTSCSASQVSRIHSLISSTNQQNPRSSSQYLLWITTLEF